MPVDEILLDAEERMEKAVDVFRHQLTGIRTGRANPGLVDSLRVEVYGSPTPIKALASVGAPEPNQIVVRPFDPGTIKDIEKAIQRARHRMWVNFVWSVHPDIDPTKNVFFSLTPCPILIS